MEALNQQYGQPHQLALQRIAELMDGPNISQGDVRAFRMFALKVRSLVMLQQLGNKGYMELECGSHVSRLLCKLPHDLQTSFRRSVHPQRVPIPTLIDLSAWLEFELQVQEDSTRFYPPMSKPMPIYKRGHQRDTRQPMKATSIFLGTEKDSSDMPTKALDPKPRDRKIHTVRQDLHILHGASVTFTVSPAFQPKTSFRIRQAFTAETLGLAEHTYPVDELQRKYSHLQGLQLPPVESVQPLLLIGSDYQFV